MKLITAKVTGQPRNVNTKHGERSVIDCLAQNGESLTIWRPAHDQQLMRLANGERIQIAIDSKGKVSLVEAAFDRAESARAEISPVLSGQTIPATRTPAVSLPMEAERTLRRQLGTAQATATIETAPEISEHLAQLGKLYLDCVEIAKNLTVTNVDELAIALFNQTSPKL